MHILQVVPYYPPAYAYGGIPRIVANLSRSLVFQGHHVSVLTTDVHDGHKRDLRPKYNLDDGVRVFTVRNLSNRLAFKQQLFLPLLDKTYFESIEELCPVDIIHLHGHRHLLNNLVIRWAKNKNIPYVFTANGTLRRHEQKELIKYGWDALLSGHIPTDASACIAVSNADMEIHREWGIEPHKIFQIPNGINLQEFDQPKTFNTINEALNIPTESPIILYLGRISPRKGVDVLVEAFHCLNSNTHLIIAGSDMGGLVRAQHLANNDPRIHFIGTVEGQQRLDLLSQATLIVYAGQKEIFGLVPFEGLLSGTPSIVSNDCGCGEIIAEADAGLLVPYGNIKLLADGIQQLLNSPEDCRAMVENGRAYIHKHLALDVVSKQHYQLYKRILSN